MKILPKIALCLSILFLSACSEKNPTAQDKVRNLLTSGMWKIQSVTIGDEDGLEFFPDLTVTFTANGFSAVNGGPVWPQSGTWAFANDEATRILRGDGVEITLVSVTDTKLDCTLYWDEPVIVPDPGRTRAVSGTHQFVFTK